MVTPVLNNIVNEFSELYGLKSIERTKHYQLTGSNRFLLTRDIDRFTTIVNEVNVTFKESENVYNVVNGAILLEKVEKEILLHDVEGVTMYETYIDERIKGTKSIWDKMSKKP